MPWLADRERAAAVAATYVVRFRAAESSQLIDPDWPLNQRRRICPTPSMTNQPSL